MRVFARRASMSITAIATAAAVVLSGSLQATASPPEPTRAAQPLGPSSEPVESSAALDGDELIEPAGLDHEHSELDEHNELDEHAESSTEYDIAVDGDDVTVSNEQSNDDTFRVSGTIMRIAAHVEGQPEVFLVLDDGPAVPLDIELPANVESGFEFSGSLAVDEVVSRLAEGALRVDDLEGASSRALAAVVPDAAVETETELPIDEGTFTAPDVAQVDLGIVRELAVAVVRPKTVKSGTAFGRPYNTANTAAITDARVAAMVDRAEQYWNRESEGDVGEFVLSALAQSSVPRYTSAYNCTSTTQAVNMWNELASFYSDEYAVSPFYTYTLLVPEGTCSANAGFSGLGHIGSTTNPFGGTGLAVLVEVPTQWGTTAERDAQGGGILIHELGHNFGLGHSNLFHCDTKTRVDHSSASDGCYAYGYMDAYDPMGNTVDAPGALSAGHKIRIGILDSTEYARPAIPAGQSTAVHTLELAPVGAESGLRGAKIKDPISGKTYFIEYRSGTGADAAAHYVDAPSFAHSATGTSYSQGTGVRIIKDGPGADMWLAASIPAYGDARKRELAMESRDGFMSYSGGIQVDVVSTSADAAVVQVTLRTTKTVGLKLPGVQVLGSPAVGTTVSHVHATKWHAPSVTKSYRWLRNGQPICAATGSSYTPNVADAGAELSIRVTASKSGYRSATFTSPAVVVPDEPGTTPALSLSLSKYTQTFGGSSATAHVSVPAGLDGTLSLMVCNTAVVKNVAIDPDGTTQIKVPSGLKSGPRAVSAVFVPNAGSGLATGTSNTVTLTVKKATVTPVTDRSASKVKRYKTASVTVRVPTKVGYVPTGKMTLYVNGKKISTKSLSSTGRVKFGISTKYVGSKKITVKYHGDSRYNPSSKTTYITVTY